MRTALRFVSLACVAMMAAACDGASPTSSASPAMGQPRRVTVSGYVTSLSIPDTLVANEDGFCDIPVTKANWSAIAAIFDSGSISASGVKYERNAAAMQALLGNIPAFSTSTVVIPDASLTPGHSPAPYNGRLVIKWYDSGYAFAYSGDIQFHCRAYVSPPPGWGHGNPPAEWP